MYRKHGLRLAQEGANAAATFVKFVLEQQPQAVGPRHEAVFHDLLTWTQKWQGIVEDNDGMAVSRDACVAVAAKLPRTAVSFAHQLIEDIYDGQVIDTPQVRPSLARAALEEALEDLKRPAPCPEWRATKLSNDGEQCKNLASNNTLMDLCGQLRYLHQEVQPAMIETFTILKAVVSVV